MMVSELVRQAVKAASGRSFGLGLGIALGLVPVGGCGETPNQGESESAADGEAGCGASLCGCGEMRTVDYTATVLDGQTELPVEAVELRCSAGGDEAELLSTSDVAGAVAFSAQWEWTPGCGYPSCGALVYHATEGPYQDAQVQVDETNGSEVRLSYLPD